MTALKATSTFGDHTANCGRGAKTALLHCRLPTTIMFLEIAKNHIVPHLLIYKLYVYI
mgnify:CR=1 FL=1